ncbi:MAG: hypothetical protein OJF50_001406 [Nitrospira sp.]|jgi:hypothetical protein|nr:hypothetical protein [Nitrospira sp.]
MHSLTELRTAHGFNQSFIGTGSQGAASSTNHFTATPTSTTQVTDLDLLESVWWNPSDGV